MQRVEIDAVLRSPDCTVWSGFTAVFLYTVGDEDTDDDIEKRHDHETETHIFTRIEQIAHYRNIPYIEHTIPDSEQLVDCERKWSNVRAGDQGTEQVKQRDEQVE
jgi:hypothetical protein